MRQNPHKIFKDDSRRGIEFSVFCQPTGGTSYFIAEVLGAATCY